jgi:hypothetical protein
MGELLNPNPRQWRRELVPMEPKRTKSGISYWHLWIPAYGILVVYGLWHFYRLVSGYRGSFIDLVMSFEGSIEIGSPASYVLAGVIAAIVVFLARMKPRPYYPVVPLDAEDEDKKPPNDGDRPAA